MKKKITLLLSVLVLFTLNIKVFAIETPKKNNIGEHEVKSAILNPTDDTEKKENIFDRIGFNKLINEDPEKEIKKLMAQYTKYASSNNIEKLKSLYSESYTNNDGFSKEAFFELFEKSSSIYTNASYTTEIKDIKIDGDTAFIHVKETDTAETIEPFEKIEGKGQIISEIEYYDYLTKEGNKWKITATDVITEKTSLKYGSAKEVKMNISAPFKVLAGHEYTTTFTTDLPDNYFIVASITNDPIKIPQETQQEIFKIIKKDKILERVMKANTNGFNEYAITSVGITQAEVKSKDSIELRVTGMAFVMTRVNISHIIPMGKIEDKKIDQAIK